MMMDYTSIFSDGHRIASVQNSLIDNGFPLSIVCTTIGWVLIETTNF